MKDEVEDWLSDGLEQRAIDKIIYAVHSLGGAMAQVAAFDHARMEVGVERDRGIAPDRVGAVVTFGAPAVGGVAWFFVRHKLFSHDIEQRYALYLSTLAYQQLRSKHGGDLELANRELVEHLRFVRGDFTSGAAVAKASQPATAKPRLFLTPSRPCRCRSRFATIRPSSHFSSGTKRLFAQGVCPGISCSAASTNPSFFLRLSTQMPTPARKSSNPRRSRRRSFPAGSGHR